MLQIKKTAGFSLIEIIIAIALLSIILTCVGLIMSNFMKNWTFAREKTEDQVAVRFALLEIIRDIRSLDSNDPIDGKYFVVEIQGTNGRKALCRAEVERLDANIGPQLISYDIETVTIILPTATDKFYKITVKGKHGLELSAQIYQKTDMALN